MKAFVLAAGFGKRMGELTRVVPKPLLPVDGYPLLCYTLFRLQQWGVRQAIVNVHYCGEQIAEYLRRFPHFPVHVAWERPDILGTAGGIRNAAHHLGDDPFLLLNPDQILLPNVDSAPFVAALQADTQACFPTAATRGVLLYLHPRSPASHEAGFSLEHAAGQPAESVRRLTLDSNGSHFYMGCSVLSPALFADLPAGEFAELLPLLMNAAEHRMLWGREFPGSVADAGAPESYARTRRLPSSGLRAEDRAQFSQFVAGWPAGVD